MDNKTFQEFVIDKLSQITDVSIPNLDAKVSNLDAKVSNLDVKVTKLNTDMSILQGTDAWNSQKAKLQ